MFLSHHSGLAMGITLSLDQCNYLPVFTQALRDSQSLVLGGNGFPPDPLQPQQNLLLVDLVMGHQC